MNIRQSPLEGCYVMNPEIFRDNRGSFVKPWHIDVLKESGLYFETGEEYYSVSKKYVLRGMHFQIPPKATKKLVMCLSGNVMDVVIDLRKNSSTKYRHFAIELKADEGTMLYIPEGFAHGFCTLSDEAIMLYMSSEVFSSMHDAGIHWNSAGISWPFSDPIVSDKDNSLVYLNDFDNPF